MNCYRLNSTCDSTDIAKQHKQIMIAPRIRTNNPCGRAKKRPPTGDRVEHQLANTQSHFSLRINAHTIETIIQFCGERMGPRESPPAIPDAPLDRTAFAKGQPAGPQPADPQPVNLQPVDPRFLKRRFEEVRATTSTGSGRIGVQHVKRRRQWSN